MIVRLLESLLASIFGRMIVHPAHVVVEPRTGGARPARSATGRSRGELGGCGRRTLCSLGVALMLWATLVPTGAAWARTVKLEAAEPLSDTSDSTLERALKSALDSCVRRATAMGLAWIWLQDATVLPNRVIVQMVASDEDPDEVGDQDEVHVIDLSHVRAS